MDARCTESYCSFLRLRRLYINNTRKQKSYNRITARTYIISEKQAATPGGKPYFMHRQHGSRLRHIHMFSTTVHTTFAVHIRRTDRRTTSPGEVAFLLISTRAPFRFRTKEAFNLDGITSTKCTVSANGAPSSFIVLIHSLMETHKANIVDERGTSCRSDTHP